MLIIRSCCRAYQFSFSIVRRTNQVTLKGVGALVAALLISLASQSASANVIEYQPGPADGNDIWINNVFNHDPAVPGGPGGGLNDDNLVVGGWGDLYYSLLQFDLTGLPGAATSVQLVLYSRIGPGHSLGTTPMQLHRIDGPWDWQNTGTGYDNNRLWWADRPPTTQLTSTPLPAPVEESFYSIDVTALYNWWQLNPSLNYGVQLTPTLTWNRWSYFYSADYLSDPSKRPKLVITYQGGDEDELPEPGILLYLGLGLLTFGVVRRRRFSASNTVE
jgi:hypothetical protein